MAAGDDGRLIVRAANGRTLSLAALAKKHGVRTFGDDGTAKRGRQHAPRRKLANATL